MNMNRMAIIISLWLISGRKPCMCANEVSDCPKVNETVKECLSEFRIFFGWDGEISLPLEDDLKKTTCMLSNYTCIDKRLLKEVTCSRAKYFLENSSYIIFCTDRGLAVTKILTCESFTEALQRTARIFCRLNSSLSCHNGSDNWVLPEIIHDMGSFSNSCIHFNEIVSSQLPLLLNPISPEAITAVVVIVCIGIIIILAGFFFWPKCHNPKAGWLPKKKLVEANADVLGMRSGHSGITNFRASSNA